MAISTHQLDLNYCYDIFDLLERLQKNEMKRHDLRREAKAALDEKVSTLAKIYASFFPFLLLVLFLLTKDTDLKVISAAAQLSTLSALIMCILIYVFIAGTSWASTYFIFLTLFERGKLRWTKKRVKSAIYTELQDSKNALGREHLVLITDAHLLHSRIPDGLLNIAALGYLIKNLEQHTDRTLEEQLDQLKIDLENDEFRRTIEPEGKSLIQRERENHYLDFLAEIFE
ncbi:hypothetical protein [Lactococcus kimchii]|uniref:hypothetical protein n=1 Tax=Lactococcus sp. S-13 TaxID=2507158 RepID=UPI001023986A|nr:hypothetical protein [Lactococcus sp. S-13]RZI48620.1 hypothetical protein EQJ87_03635 [Lactococcus sp. S-13]